MTYPPQQPGSGPNPHGGYGPPPQGPRQPGQQPGYSSQHPRPYGPAQQGFGGFGVPGPHNPPPPPGPPPRRSSTGLIVSLVLAGVLVIGAVLITGLISPGWMLGDRPTGESPQTQVSPKDVLQRYVTAINARDLAAVHDEECQGADAPVFAEKIPQGARIDVGEQPKGGDSAQDSATVSASLPGAGSLDYRVELRHAAQGWCVQRVRGIAGG